MVAGLSISYLTNSLTEREPRERLNNLADQLLAQLVRRRAQSFRLRVGSGKRGREYHATKIDLSLRGKRSEEIERLRGRLNQGRNQGTVTEFMRLGIRSPSP